MPPSSPPSTLPFLDHLAAESSRFRDVLANAPSGVRVPTCPEWDADDLLWHLGEVQWFWGEIAERRLTTAAEVAAMRGSREQRPVDRAALVAFFERASERLHRTLSELPPDTELWMWHDDHSAGYIRRRQAHEALMHRLDAELTVGQRTPLDAALCTDGTDEVLRIMRGYVDEPGLTATPMGGPVTLVAVDTMHAWTARPVRVVGTDSDGDDWDVKRFVIDDITDSDVTTEICASAADLDCWLWNRPTTDEVTRTGDETALAAVDDVLRSPID